MGDEEWNRGRKRAERTINLAPTFGRNVIYSTPSWGNLLLRHPAIPAVLASCNFNRPMICQNSSTCHQRHYFYYTLVVVSSTNANRPEQTRDDCASNCFSMVLHVFRCCCCSSSWTLIYYLQTLHSSYLQKVEWLSFEKPTMLCCCSTCSAFSAICSQLTWLTSFKCYK